MLGVGVPDPFGEVADPGLAAILLQAPHQVIVGKSIQAAEDLTDNADDRDGRVPVNGHGVKTIAAAHQTVADGAKLHGRRGRGLLDGRAEVVQTFFVNRVDVALVGFMRPVMQQHLLQDVGGEQPAPGRAHERSGQFSQPAIGVVAGRREDLGLVVAVGRQNLLQIGGVLPEAAGPVGGRHEQHHLGRVNVRPLQQLHEVTDRDLGRVALVARGVARAQLAGVIVRRRNDVGVHSQSTEDSGKGPAAAVRHGGNVGFLAL